VVPPSKQSSRPAEPAMPNGLHVNKVAGQFSGGFSVKQTTTT